MPRKKKGDEKSKFSSESAIVKHSNHLAEIPLQRFNARDVDLFFGLCYKVQNQGTNRVVIGFEEMRRLLNYTETSNARMIKDLKEMSFKFASINLVEQQDNLNFKIVVPFIDFEVNSSDGTFTVGVHQDFAAALNELDGSEGKRYTLSDVVGIAKMKSVYAKQCLKMIYMYRTTGVWYTTIKGFRYALSIPDSYKANDVKKRVIDVIDKEFHESDLFEFFEIIERRSEKKTKGRPSIEGYTFFFRFNQTAGVNQEGDAEDRTIICPICNRPLKKIARKDGTGYFYGHPDWRQENAPCQYTYSIKEAAKMGADEEGVDEEGSSDKGISIGELRRYYDYICEEEEKAAGERRSEIKEKHPEIWTIYEDKEAATIEHVSALSSLPPLSEGSREAWKKRKQESKEKKEALQRDLEDALEKAGYERDYLRRKYRCDKCKDTGTKEDGHFCECRKERAEEAAEWLKS